MTQFHYQISDKKFWDDINAAFNNGGGVYELYCTTSNNKPIPVCRLLKEDKSGVLYIGKADSFLDRVIELKKSISPNYVSGNHECGVRYKESFAIKEKFPYENLYVKLTGAENPRLTETEKLDGYIKEFGEVPPLNRMG